MAGCESAPAGLRRTPSGLGAEVRWSLVPLSPTLPFPEVPWPNDALTSPDPTSRTGLRLQPSLLGATDLDLALRVGLAELDGWGRLGPITVSFDAQQTDPAPPARGEVLHLANLAARHPLADADPTDDAVYLVDLDAAALVPIDLAGLTPTTLLQEGASVGYLDAHAGELGFAVETGSEPLAGSLGSPAAPEHDLDFDGVADRASLADGADCGPRVPCSAAPCSDEARAHARCVADSLLPHYERETDTLVLRPLAPLAPGHRHAVVLTDRLLDAAGRPVRSPLPFVYPAEQEPGIARLAELTSNPVVAGGLGDLAGSGLEHVAFAWTFTTHALGHELPLLRDGLDGAGPLAALEQTSPSLEVVRAVGLTLGTGSGALDPPGWETSPEGVAAGCPTAAANPYRVAMSPAVGNAVADLLGVLAPAPRARLVRSLGALSHLVVARVRAPFLLSGGPLGVDPSARFPAGLELPNEVSSAEVPLLLAVPKASAQRAQPFDAALYVPGRDGTLAEALEQAGHLATEGLATVALLPHGQGATAAPAWQPWASACAAPLLDALTLGRARDLDANAAPDPSVELLGPHALHTRDVLRQTTLEAMVVARALRSLGEETMRCRTELGGWGGDAGPDCDLDGDGNPELAGDFDADGVVDVGAAVAALGRGSGASVATMAGTLDDASAVVAISAEHPAEVAVRAPPESLALGLVGPLVAAVDPAALTPCDLASPAPGCTLCDAGEHSVRFVVAGRAGRTEVEIECVPTEALADSTVFVTNLDGGLTSCTSTSASGAFQVGLAASAGDRVALYVYPGRHRVLDYGSCAQALEPGELPSLEALTWGGGPLAAGASAPSSSDLCEGLSCRVFEGTLLAEGAPLVAPAAGLGLHRQSPALRRALEAYGLAVEPGDARLYVGTRAMGTLALGSLGDPRSPVSSTVSLAQALGVIPFAEPDPPAPWGHHATPQALFAQLGGATPLSVLASAHAAEGTPWLARHPASPLCAKATSTLFPDGQYLTSSGGVEACFAAGCASSGVACADGQGCDQRLDRCAPPLLGEAACEAAPFDLDDLDEGATLAGEQSPFVPLRLARYASSPQGIDAAWSPRLLGAPFAADGAFVASDEPLSALLLLGRGTRAAHGLEPGDPCLAFDTDTYAARVVARYLASRGADLAYLTRPASHRCLATESGACP
jgi:hypothetical protein